MRTGTETGTCRRCQSAWTQSANGAVSRSHLRSAGQRCSVPARVRIRRRTTLGRTLSMLRSRTGGVFTAVSRYPSRCGPMRSSVLPNAIRRRIRPLGRCRSEPAPNGLDSCLGRRSPSGMLGGVESVVAVCRKLAVRPRAGPASRTDLRAGGRSVRGTSFLSLSYTGSYAAPARTRLVRLRDATRCHGRRLRRIPLAHTSSRARETQRRRPWHDTRSPCPSSVSL